MAADFSDWIAICETKARYCRFLDTKNWAGWTECFTEDFVLDTPPAGNITQGRDAAIAYVRGSVETATTAHQIHNPEMAFAEDGLSADVVWAMNDRVSWSAERAAELGVAGHTGYGHYHEHYVKSPNGKWRIARTKLSYLAFDRHELRTGSI